LDYKFNKEPFGDTLALIKMAEKATHLFARCSCGKDAIYTHLNKNLVSNLNAQIIIGGSEKYRPVCEKCYDQLNH
jgi:thymidine kinase